MTQPHARFVELKAALVRAVNELYDHGLVTPTGGNLSVRCPDGDHILITASQVYKGALGPEHILEVDLSGRVVETPGWPGPIPGVGPGGAAAPATMRESGTGDTSRLRPSIETGMHLAIYAARADVEAVVHTHAPLASVWSLYDEPVPPLTIDAVRFTDIRTVPFAPPGSSELATSTAEALARSPAVLLRNHGLVTVGADLRQAVNTALALEEALKVAILARLLAGGLAGREPALIPPRAADFLRKLLVG